MTWEVVVNEQHRPLFVFLQIYVCDRERIVSSSLKELKIVLRHWKMQLWGATAKRHRLERAEDTEELVVFCFFENVSGDSGTKRQY